MRAILALSVLLLPGCLLVGWPGTPDDSDTGAVVDDFGHSRFAYRGDETRDFGLTVRDGGWFFSEPTGTVNAHVRMRPDQVIAVPYTFSGKLDVEAIATEIGGDFSTVGIDTSTGGLRVSAAGSETFDTPNLLDGEWHAISVAFVDNAVTGVFVDGVAYPVTASITGFRPFQTVGFLHTNFQGGAHLDIAEVATYSAAFELADHVEFYNGGGGTIDPRDHTQLASLASVFPLGDDPLDNTEVDGFAIFADSFGSPVLEHCLSGLAQTGEPNRLSEFFAIVIEDSPRYDEATARVEP